MKGIVLLLLSAVALSQADRPQLSHSGQVCECHSEEAKIFCFNGLEGAVIAHENCNQFYKCSNGKAIPFFCPSNLLFDPSTQECNWPQNVVCGSRPIVESGNGCSEEKPEVPEKETNCDPAEAPKICAADGSDGVLIAHENCNQFYKCANGVPVGINCPNGLLYNPFIEQCDWPENVDCGNRPIIEIDNGEGNGDNGNTGTCNCNPDEAPGICAADGSDGILVAHEKCNQFYKCANGVPVGLNCPGGLVYNPFIEQCDWPENVDCGNRPIIEIDNGEGNGDNGNTGTCNCNPDEAPGICAADGSDGILVAHENCNQFYKCANGVPVCLNCPGGLVYNPYTEQCDWPENVDCGNRPIIEIDNGEGNGDNGNTGTCNCNPDEAPGICAADGSDGILVAHENCNQFYKCVNGVPVGLNCPGGLVYNPYTEKCDWPENVDCGNRPIIEIDNGEGNGDNGNTGTCNCNPDEAPGICAADGSDGILVAHENCNQFYKCANGVPVGLNCPGGLVYNPYTEQCDWPENVDCGNRPIIEIDNGEGNGDNGNTGTCNCNPDEAPGICAADGSDGILIAHENCNQFYKCANGVPVGLNCPGGLVYNPFIEQCDWPENVDCGNRPIIEIDNGEGNGDNGNTGTCNCNPDEAPDICAADGSDGILVAHENCNQFYKCANGVPVGLNCPGGLVYNPFTEQCDWPENVDCGNRPIIEIDNGEGNGDNGNTGTCNCNPDEAPGICAADGSDGILVAHENCNQFYKCANGVPVCLNCPSGLVYNPYTEKCDWPENVDCGNRPIIEIDNGGGNGDNGNTGTCNCNPDEAPGICAADGSDGILVAHENCNQFYKCANGVPVGLNCPGGLVYNPFIEQCDWPENVDCGNRPIIEIDNGEGNGDNGNTGTCNCNPDEAPGICAADGSDGILVAHENCNQFYKCANGVPVGLNCPGGLVYNPFTEQCDWPENVDCGNRPIIEIDNGEGNGDNGNTGTCNCNPDEAPGICAADGSDGILIAHENCNQFYKCANGVPVGLNCPGGLVYNPFTEQCDWPENVDCGNRPIIEIDNGEGNGDNGNTGTCNCNPEEAPGICAADGSDGILVAHENCNQFYKCANGVPVGLNCPGSLVYNPNTEKCDWPENVDCGSRPIIEIDNGGDNGDNGNTGTCNCNPSEAPAICSSGKSEGVLVAHEVCNKFYICSFGLPVALACPKDLLYNPFIEQCDWPENVECGERIIPEDNGGNDNSGDNNGEDSNDEGNADPSLAPTICAASDSSGILVAHENCNQFYVCESSSPVAMRCPSNLFYNPKTRECDWPTNVNCGERLIPEPHVSDGTCLCNSKQARPICAESNSDGKMIAHESCAQYYVCFNGVPIARSCPVGLLYDPYTEQCNWSSAVSCKGRDTLSLNKHQR